MSSIRKNTKILVVDDDEKIIFAFTQFLEMEGYPFLTAKDGSEALQKVKNDQPQVIFMDIAMPNVDGLEALKLIKEQDESIPVIMITGNSTTAHAFQAVQLGAFDCLPKPLSVIKIRETIRNALLFAGTHDVKSRLSLDR